MQDRFTVYDVFANLIPGVVFIYLAALTLDRAAGIQIFDWTGGVGDATLLVIFGYAAGAFLQGLGNVAIDRVWLRVRGGQPTATLLMPDSNRLSGDLKDEVRAALVGRYGEMPPAEKAQEYRKSLEEKTYRALKALTPNDPTLQRFQAEHHAMRAFVTAFLVLAAVTLVGGSIYATLSWKTHGTLTIVYLVLFAVTLWRMENVATTFARHALTMTSEEFRSRKGAQ